MRIDSPPPMRDGATIPELIHRITDDVRTIARDEMALVTDELRHVAKAAAADVAALVFGAIVALIGFAMLCVAAVVALAPLIPSLALRLFLMSIVFVGVGAALAVIFGRRLPRDARPDLTVPIYQAKSTYRGAKATLQERGHQAHA